MTDTRTAVLDQPLQPVVRDIAAAHELRRMLTTSRMRLQEVLHQRTRDLHEATAWVGPHRQRYDEDAADLLAAGRLLDAALRDLLVGLDAELEASNG